MSQSFTREAALRLLRVSERQLKELGTAEALVEPVAPVYSFRELLALRTLIKLRESKVAPAADPARGAGADLKKLRGVDDPLTQLKLYADGRRVHVDLDQARDGGGVGAVAAGFRSGRVEPAAGVSSPGGESEG